MRKRKVSRLQLRANRLNAKLSIGPKTPEGKAASLANLEKAQTARRAAARYRFIHNTAINDTEIAALQIMHDEAILQHKPANEEELHIVEHMIRNQFNIWRYQMAQDDILANFQAESLRAAHPAPELRCMQDASIDPKFTALERLIVRAQRLRSRLYADLRLSRKLQAESAANLNLPQPAPVGEEALQQILEEIELEQVAAQIAKNTPQDKPINTSLMETNPPDTLEPAA